MLDDSLLEMGEQELNSEFILMKGTISSFERSLLV